MKRAVNYFLMLLGLILSFSHTLSADTNNNDTCGNAETVTLDYSTTAGSISSTDRRDYYRFTPPSDGRVTITATPTNNRDLNGYLDNADCSVLLASDTRNASNVLITYDVSGGVMYKFFLYYNSNNNSTNYSLSITFTPRSLAEINVVGVADGGTDTSFGTTLVTGGTINKTYTIQNIGTQSLTVGSIIIGGTNSSDFTVTSPPAGTVAAGGTTTFTIRFDPSAVGTRTATVSFSNNDDDENPYNFNISGEGDGPPIMGNVTDYEFPIGQPVSVDLSSYVTLTGGDPILYYTLTGTLPDGLSFDSTTGILSGTPTTFQTTSLAISATDADGQSNIDTFSITVGTLVSGLHSFDKINPADTFNVRGNYAIAGNTVMCLTDKTDGTVYNYYTHQYEPLYDGYGGNCIDTGAELLTSNLRVSKYIDIDGDGSTWNSTSSYINVPSTFDNSPTRGVLWAGLFWQGRLSNSDDYDKRYYVESGSSYTAIETKGVSTIDFANSGADTIKLKVDTGAYQEARAATLYKSVSGQKVSYAAYADVTDMVNAAITSSGKHTFTVANLTTNEGREGSPGVFGGWSLVVIYAETSKGKTRNISVYSGLDMLQNNSTNDPFTITDFKLPTSDVVHATLSLFSGEGEYLYGNRPYNTDHYDWVKVSNTGLDADYEYMPGANNNNNIFDAKFDGILRDNVTGYSNNLQVNNDGVDIDNYDVSALMTRYRDANPDMHELYIKWKSNEDYITPSMIVFATELYAPKLCYDYSFKQDGRYLTAENNGTEMPLLQGDVSDSPLEVSVFIRNIESDIAASNVSFYTTDVNSTLFSYVNNSIQSSNVNGSVMYPRNDSGTGCNYHDSATTPIGCVNGSNVRIGLGENATGYSVNGAGDFGSQDFAFASFSLQPRFSGVRDLNESLGLSVDYTIRPDGVNADIEYNYVLGVNMDMCPPSAGYQPTWGIFNVVEHGAKTINNLPVNNIRTQISRKKFDTDVAVYEKNTDGTYTKIPEVDLNTTLMVEIIDTDAYHDTNTSCKNPGSAITEPIFVRVANTSQDMTIDIPAQLNSYYNFAVKNAAFRIWYFDQNNTLIDWSAATTDTTRRDLQSISGLYQSSYHTLCATECSSSPGSTNCFACIRSNYAKPLCSRDNFSVRPESYSLRIFDINQSLAQTDPLKSATKVDLTKQYQFSPEFGSALGRMNITAGYNYRFDVNATGNDTNLSSVPGYTRNFKGANPDYNATLMWRPSTTKTGCNDTESKYLNFFIGNGSMVNTEQNQTQVGEYQLNIIDPSWTEVDWNPVLMTHHTAGNYFDTTTVDCITGSDTSEKATNTDRVGCVTTSNHTGGGYYYKDHEVTLKPSYFDLSSISYGVGLTPVGIAAGNAYYAYDANLANNDEQLISPRAYGRVQALGYSGETLSNFVADCYASDIKIAATHDANTTDYRFVARMSVLDVNNTEVYNSGEVDANGSAHFIVNDGNFTKAGMGQINPTIRMNFDRNATTPIPPQIVAYYDLNVSCAFESDCNTSAFSNHYPNTAKGTDLMDFNITHVYGRFYPRDVRVMGLIEFGTTGSFEVYKTDSLLGTALIADSFNNNWYVNRLHTLTNEGRADITVVSPESGSSLPNNTAYDNNGTMNYDFNAFTIRQNYIGHIDTGGWLWWGDLTALEYQDPNGAAIAGADNFDCRTHPCFNITFGRIIGNTGSAKTESESDKKNKKTDSGTGWKSSSEYAPQIR